MRAHYLQHVRFEGIGSIHDWLRDHDAQVTATRFFDDPRLPSVDDVDLLIVMGGPMSVNNVDVHPWLVAEREFIREAIERDVAVVGVCLGAQLIARALGARVYRNLEPEIGWFPITGLSGAGRSPSWASAGRETTVFHWHGETFDLPAGATPLARSAGCAHQAFRVGDQVIGIQFHLETTPSLVAEMVAHGRAELIPSRFVQSETEILAADAARFTALNALMAHTLDVVTGLGIASE